MPGVRSQTEILRDAHALAVFDCKCSLPRVCHVQQVQKTPQIYLLRESRAKTGDDAPFWKADIGIYVGVPILLRSPDFRTDDKKGEGGRE
jgi:hypothetical protein